MKKTVSINPAVIQAAIDSGQLKPASPFSASSSSLFSLKNILIAGAVVGLIYYIKRR